MRTFTAVTPATTTLPPELALLASPVHLSEPSAPGEHVGRGEGVLLDERGCVVAFLVRLSPELVATMPRVFVSASAVTVTDDSVLHLGWTEDQLLHQPRLDDALRAHD